MLRKARKLAALIGRRRWLRGLRHGVAATIEHRAALGRLDLATVVDIGANKGQFALFARAAFPAARVISFEPLASACATFRAVFDGDPAVRLVEAAIAPRAGSHTIHVSQRADSSSLLPIGARQEAIFPGTGLKEEATIATARLSDCLRETEIAAPALLKLDVQGYELEALRGCEELLHCFDYIYCECSFVELYEGQALYGDVAAFLAGHGLRERGRFNATHDPRLGPVQADILFVRDATRSGPRFT